MGNSIRALMIAIVCLAAMLAPAPAVAQGAGVASHPMIGEPAPAFDLEEVSGDTLSLEELRGRFVILHFGASW